MPPILYLHGFASSPGSRKATHFRRLLESRGAPVEVPDLAEGRFEQLTISAQLAVIERAARNRPVSLIGSSMGGYLAALYSARHPEVHRLVLMAPAFGFARRWNAWLGSEGVAQWRERGTLGVFHYGENRQCEVSYRLFEDAQQYEEFPNFSQPALIFHGAHDDVVPAELSREFAAAHPYVTLEVLDSDHGLLDMLDYMGATAEKFLLADQ